LIDSSTFIAYSPKNKEYTTHFDHYVKLFALFIDLECKFCYNLAIFNRIFCINAKYFIFINYQPNHFTKKTVNPAISEKSILIMVKENHPLRINIGFIVHEDIGYSRTFDFSFPSINLDSDLVLTEAAGAATFTRTQEGILAGISFSGITTAECGRCLDATDVKLNSQFTELFSFHYRQKSETDLVLPEHGQIDLAPILREYLLLDMPINPLCKSDCLGLCLHCGKNLNTSPHEHKEEKLDPRLSVLKDLLKKDKD